MESIGIITALSRESHTIFPHLQAIEIQRKESFTLIKGRFMQRPVYVVQSGIGRKNAVMALETLIEEARPGVLLSCGWAGALNPDFAIGEIVIVEKVMGPPHHCFPGKKYGERGETSKQLRQSLGKFLTDHGIGFSMASIITVDTPLATAREKANFFSTYRVGAVDMETSALVECANRKGLPLAGLRVISDHVSMEFDLGLLKHFNDKGKLGFLAHAARKPKAFMQLLNFRYGTHIACKHLTNVIYPALCALGENLRKPG